MTEKRVQENIREITKNENRLGHNQVLLGSSEATNVISDSTITPIADGNDREGWFLKNTVSGTKFNLYIFGGDQEIIKKSEIRSLYFLANIDNLNNLSSIPFLHIYTKPTGVNDAKFWYHSRYDYRVDFDSVKMGVGEQCLFYANDKPIDKPRKYQSQRHIPMSDTSIDGESDEHGEILYIVISSDSGAVLETMQCCLQMVGFETNETFTENEINSPVRNFYFKTPSTTEHKREKEQIIVANTTIASNTDIGSPIDCGNYKYINIYGTATGNHSINVYTSGDGGSFYFFQESLYPNHLNGMNYFYIQMSQHLQHIKLVNDNTSNTFTLNYVLSN